MVTVGVAMALRCAPAAADVAVEAYRVEVVAPAPVKAAVERSLDLVRWQSYAEITPEFFDLLVADARAQARDAAAAQGYFSAVVTSEIDRSTKPETVRLRIEPGQPTTVASVELLVPGGLRAGRDVSGGHKDGSDISLEIGCQHFHARTKIAARREKILKDQDMANALGFPLKRRDDAPKTYSASVVRKELPIQRPTVSASPFKPEPTLEMAQYENILEIISSMVHVIERSPGAFARMKEEDLRQHFLVQLNGQYKGQATGETFNASGKTDILIRVEDRNIFIAECKFWKGEKHLIPTIDQLLSYTSWRDTKTAIILFNQQKNLTDILAQIPVTVATHPNFKKQLPDQHETGFRFLMHQPGDKNRELYLTVLVFEVPAK